MKIRQNKNHTVNDPKNKVDISKPGWMDYIRKFKILLMIFGLVVIVGVVLYFYLNERIENKIEVLFESQSYRSLITLCDEQLALEPNNIEMRFQKGKAYYYLALNYKTTGTVSAENTETVHNYFKQAISIFFSIIIDNLKKKNTEDIYPLNSKFYYYLGRSFFHLGETLGSTYYRAAYNYFRISLWLNRYDDSFSAIIDTDEISEVRLYEILGLITYNLKYYDISSKYFEIAAEKNPTAWNNYSLGVCYYHLGEPGKAIQYLEKVLNYTTETSILIQVYKYLASINADQKNFQQSQQYYDKLLELVSTENQMDNQLARIHFQRGLLFEQQSSATSGSQSNEFMRKAFNEWRSALEYDPQFGDAMIRLLRYNQQL